MARSVKPRSVKPAVVDRFVKRFQEQFPSDCSRAELLSLVNEQIDAGEELPPAFGFPEALAYVAHYRASRDDVDPITRKLCKVARLAGFLPSSLMTAPGLEGLPLLAEFRGNFTQLTSKAQREVLVDLMHLSARVVSKKELSKADEHLGLEDALLSFAEDLTLAYSGLLAIYRTRTR